MRQRHRRQFRQFEVQPVPRQHNPQPRVFLSTVCWDTGTRGQEGSDVEELVLVMNLNDLRRLDAKVQEGIALLVPRPAPEPVW